MAEKFTANLNDDLVIDSGYIIRFSALSPTTGAAISGVSVSNVALQAADQGEGSTAPTGPFMLVPGPENG